jgi:1,2-phenylacetyl-CoA epoxidase catalytic subunit
MLPECDIAQSVTSLTAYHVVHTSTEISHWQQKTDERRHSIDAHVVGWPPSTMCGALFNMQQG